MNHTKIFSKRI